MLPALCVFSAAMFAEPAVTEIEEVVGLVHGKKGVGCRVLGVVFEAHSKYRAQAKTP